MAGLFIDVEVADEIRNDAEIAQKLADACPVDIFANNGGKLEIVEENLDECILCELCVRAAPPGTVRVKKLYDGTVLERSGAEA
jgi:NAD-dependent dihydropyrimidine dehydrogenase PreA subunit